MEKLQTLKNIFQQGWISQSEYERRLSQLIDQLTAIQHASASDNSPDCLPFKKRKLSHSTDALSVEGTKPICKSCLATVESGYNQCENCTGKNRSFFLARSFFFFVVIELLFLSFFFFWLRFTLNIILHIKIEQKRIDFKFVDVSGTNRSIVPNQLSVTSNSAISTSDQVTPVISVASQKEETTPDNDQKPKEVKAKFFPPNLFFFFYDHYGIWTNSLLNMFLKPYRRIQ